MIATLAALQLVLLSQVAPPPKEVTPDESPGESAPAENPPLPEKPSPAASAPAAPAAAARPRQLSLLSAESLGGGSTAMAWAGWRSLGIAYAQGITKQDDLGAFLDLDWSTAELRLGAMYRRPLGQAGVFDMAARLAVAWYQNFAATWVYDENHSDRGVEFAPGLSLSKRQSGGVLSLIADAPLTITTKYGSGLLFSPRFSVAYEAPLYPEVTLGARLGLGYRAGSGDAPLKEGKAEFLFLVVATYQLL
ncbi:MAG TPA: hypothetical protein VFL83_05505 [Anaeromyxobacter sp.]|nr:hypothetical protein [Anaeromyxobacter sp.]